MKIIKEGGHRLFETDPETARYVAQMLEEIRRRGREVGAVTARQCDIKRMHAHAITAHVRVDRYASV